ncbi:uncharacterized protein LOC144638092 isoform X2 [Oculina patagonica]
MPNIVLILFFFTAWNVCLTEAGDGATCRMKTKDNKCCVFPFIYRGTTYHTCITSRANSPWCALSPSYDQDKKYGYCRGMEALITGDDQSWVYANGKYLGNDNGRWDVPVSFYFPADLQVVAIYVKNCGGPTGLIGSFANGIVTDNKWKCTTQAIRNWHTTGFDDSNWPAATVHGDNSGGLRVSRVASNAKWIGPSYRNAGGFYCRRRMTYFGEVPSVGGSCDKPLGVQSGWVENSQMRASSAHSNTHAAWRGRLNMPKQYSYPGAWSARANNAYQWLEVSFHRPVQITACATQGRADYDQWVTSYTLSYSEDGSKYSVYSVGGHQKVFTGNRDRNSVVKHNVSPNIEARFLRLHPKTWHNHISMRMELYGCLKVCKVDIGILMDESGSVSTADFERQKNFVKSLAGHFQFGPSAAQFGVISFSTGAQLDIALNKYGNLGLFQRGVSAIRHAGGWTYTGKALNLAYSQLFISSKGARANVAKVLIIITDGQSTGGMPTLKDPIKKLKDASVNIISIGVGDKTNRNELNFMASSPANTHVFSVQNMNQLRTLIGSITASSCQTYNCRYVTCDYSQWSTWSASCGVSIKRTRGLTKVNEHYIKRQGGCSGLKVTCDKQETETKTTNCPCVSVTCSWNSWGSWSSTCGRMSRQRTSKVTQSIIHRPNCNGLQTTCPKPEVQSLYVSCCKGELGILMDESGSIKDGDFVQQKDFIKSLANGFTNFGPNGMQMAVISYSTDANLDIKLNQYSNKMQFINAVRSIRQFKGWTYTDKALNVAKNELFQTRNGARPGVTKILVVLTDGASTGGEKSLRVPLQNLKESYVNIFAIGIGRNINRRELEMMATAPVNEHIFYVANMQELQTLLTRIGESACKKYKCRYVTCDYSVWSSWSTSCGNGMKRKRTLTKQNEHIKEQQGGCSGLTTTCEKEKVETKNSLCPCTYVTCSWNSWGGWSATCGQITRQRTSKITKHVVNRPNCNGLQTTCPAPQTESTFISCCKVELGVMMDESGSIDSGDFTREKNFVALLADGFSNFGPNGVQMGVITFATTADLDIKLSQHSTKASFMAAAKNIRQRGGWTYTGRALKLAKDGLFQVSNGARPGVTKMLLIVTDGASTGGIKTLQIPVAELKAMKVNIFSVGVGKNLNRNELEFMASEPKDSHLFYVRNMAELPKLLHTLAKSSCQVFKCKYVTCDYSVWSSWSISCGVGMKRKRTLTKQNEHIIEQQGGCSGLQTSCDKEELETKDMDCQCRYVTCSWNDWSSWTATCGESTRQRTSKVTNHVINKPSCSGLQTSCPGPRYEKRTTNCPCKSVRCTWKPWTDWSATCGLAERTRSIQTTQIVVQQPDCSGLPQTCTQPPQKETRKTMCTCQTVQCAWSEWSDWSATCGAAKRTRTIQTSQITVQKESCDGLPQSCPQPPESEHRTTDCACRTVSCKWEEWSSWSTTCGVGTRTRDIQETEITVNKPSCAGLPQKCTEQPQTESREVKCACPTVECKWNQWSDWSATCGAAKRRRTIKTIKTTVQKLKCEGLPQSCPQPPETEQQTTNCKCKTVNCEWALWSSWSTTCGVGTRTRHIEETAVEVFKPDCSGLPQTCPQPPESDARELKCTCPTVKCNWKQWSAWSATCGSATRTRSIETVKTTVQKLKCEGLPQSCPQPPETEQQITNCKCKTVNCEWALWSSWSTTCGVGTRTRHIEETAVEVFKPDCSGLPQTCPQPPESDARDIKCNCQTVNCKRGEWEAWSATCGLATRKRSITTEQIVVQQSSCDGLPQSCPSGPETETRKSMCTCQSVTCTWGKWGNWSGECGEVNRTRHIVETQTTVQAESCDGVLTKCTQQPETENNKLPECEECYTVECSYNPWSSWSATCGSAYRRRIQVIEEIELLRPSCDGLPLECPGDQIQEEKRTTPLCPTTLPPPKPTT